MKNRVISLALGAMLLVCAAHASSAAAASTPPLKDPKGTCLLVACDRSAFAGSAVDDLLGALGDAMTSSAPECRLVTIDTGAKAGLRKAVDQLGDAELGALVVLDAARGGSATHAGVHHYAFQPIDGPHVPSPEYSFKFASDSALLAICLHDAAPWVEIEPAGTSPGPLPAPVLGKTLQLSVPDSVARGGDEARAMGAALAAAFKAFRGNQTFSVMGVVSDKALKHAQTASIEVRLHKFLYADKEYSKEEEAARKKSMEAVVQTAKPAPSGIYWFTNLDGFAPYTVSFIDTSRDEGAFHRQPDTARFLTGSIPGIVRTVPGLVADYRPLPAPRRVDRSATPEAAELDYVIRRATVFTGERNARPRTADVGVRGDRIAAVGNLAGRKATRTIDGKGLYLMPGFIDIHSHADSTIFQTPHAPSHIRQGITTTLGGNCASSTATIGTLLAILENNGAPVNLAMLIGNTPVRRTALGNRKGMFPYADLYREKEILDLAMEEGAFGMSSGLIYSTSEEAFAWELAELCRQMQPYGGFYASHVRGEADEVLDAVREGIHIAELAQVPFQVSHMKVLKKHNWGHMDDYIRIMKAARARGLDVTGDQYPWEASGPAAHNSLYDLIVREAIGLDQPEVILLENMPGKYAKYSGRNLSELLEGEKMTAEDLVKDLDLKRGSKIYATYICIGDKDICRAMKEDFVMVCTDSSLVTPREMEPARIADKHPRSFRTYPQFLAHYVRDRGVVAWPLAVYKCTKLPAERMKLDDRGVIRPGACADIVVLDPQKLDPVAGFGDQTPPPKGIEYVFINGQLALDGGEMTNIRAGRPLYAYGNRKP